MLWDTMNAGKSDIAMDCTSFHLPRHNIGQMKRGGSNNSRRLNMDFDLDGDTTNVTSPSVALHDMSIDELSFYDDENSTSLQQDFIANPTPLAGLLSPEGSPRRFQVVDGTTVNCCKTVPGSSTTFYQFGRQQKLQSSTMNSRPSTTTKETTITSTTATTTKTVILSGGKNFRTFHSLSSSGSIESASMDDDYMELLEMESFEQLHDENSQSCLNFPSDLNSLISGAIKSVTPPILAGSHNLRAEQIKTPDLMRRSSVRRCLSMTENNYNSQYQSTQPKTPELLKEVHDSVTTPFTSRLTITAECNSPCSINKSNYSTNLNSSYCFKRPEPPSMVNSPVQSKRYRSAEEKENMHMFCKQSITTVVSGVSSYGASGGGVLLRKCMSMNDAEIMTALARSENKDEPDLIGDFSKPFALPLIEGRHRDLKSISSDTVARLLKGDFDDKVANYTIIDCRYPYEYEGGHIRGAKNLYTQEQIIEEFLIQQKTDQQNARSKLFGQRRNIIIFHCEFSSERGPKLSRFLRNNDRARNTNAYPTLDYPEIYLLHNGYKEFYETHATFCDPESYRPMLEPSYTEAYRHFRAKSKSWNGDMGCGTTSRFKKSRSRLML